MEKGSCDNVESLIVESLKKLLKEASLNRCIVDQRINGQRSTEDQKDPIPTNNDQRAERIANDLVRRFKDERSRKFFLKCAYHLSEAEIYSNVELASQSRVKAPAKYFTVLCKKAMDA